MTLFRAARDAACRFCLLVAASYATPAAADPPVQAVEEMSDKVEATRDREADPQRRSILIVPIPQSSPTLGTGLTLVGAVFYNPNQSREPWITGVGAMYTSNGSRAIGVLHKMTLVQDHLRVTAFAGYADVNVRFYGTGPIAGERDLSIELNERGYAGMLQGQFEVAPHLFAGARLSYLDIATSINRDEPLFPDAEIPRFAFDSQLAQVGPVISYDLRDSTLNPHNGALVSFSWLFADSAIGSDFNYNKATLAGNIYRPLGPNTVIAARASVCSVSDGAPFFDQCLFGAASDLRGYEAGRYRDNASWAAQVELRQHLFWRIGVVAFAGIGGTAPSLGQIGETRFLPAGGVGLRIMPVPSAGVNVRIDYAVGRDSNALYVSVGEAF